MQIYTVYVYKTYSVRMASLGSMLTTVETCDATSSAEDARLAPCECQIGS